MTELNVRLHLAWPILKPGLASQEFYCEVARFYYIRVYVCMKCYPFSYGMFIELFHSLSDQLEKKISRRDKVGCTVL